MGLRGLGDSHPSISFSIRRNIPPSQPFATNRSIHFRMAIPRWCCRWCRPTTRAGRRSGRAAGRPARTRPAPLCRTPRGRGSSLCGTRSRRCPAAAHAGWLSLDDVLRVPVVPMAEIVGVIRSTPQTPRRCIMERPSLGEISCRIDGHIIDTFFELLQARRPEQGRDASCRYCANLPISVTRTMIYSIEKSDRSSRHCLRLLVPAYKLLSNSG